MNSLSLINTLVDDRRSWLRQPRFSTHSSVCMHRQNQAHTSLPLRDWSQFQVKSLTTLSVRLICEIDNRAREIGVTLLYFIRLAPLLLRTENFFLFWPAASSQEWQLNNSAFLFTQRL